MNRIPVSGPSISKKEIDYVTDAVTNAWYGNASLYHERFENAFSSYIGTKYAMALPSCTSAIHLTLLSYGIGPGDEVIVPEITWIASVAPVIYVGATPVFVDIDEKTWCLSAESFEKNITPKTRAVIPVDLYGGIPDMDSIRKIANAHSIIIIEDAAEAIGSEYNGKKSGSFGNVGVFSFHGSKTMTTGEGGMLVTDDEAIYSRANILRDHGRKPGDFSFFNSEVAFKYKMSGMQAALGLAQLERIDELVDKKRCIFNWYLKELGSVSDLTLNYEPSNVKNSYWMVSAIINNRTIDKEALRKHLSDRGIDTRPFFHPLSSLPAFSYMCDSNLMKIKNPVSYKLSPSGINLPSGMNLTEEMVSRICSELKDTLFKIAHSN